MDKEDAFPGTDEPPPGWLKVFWRRGRWLILGIGTLLGFVVSYWLINTPSLPGWTNFNDKGLWDILDLIIVPLTVAGVGAMISSRQKEVELKIAQEERKNERRIAEDREQEQALQGYFDRMTMLLLERRLCETPEGSEERSIARSRTLTTLRHLNPDRKGALLKFLFESKLIGERPPVISLYHADLSTIKLERATLNGANLENAILTGALLKGADLASALLKGANLTSAILESATLERADLTSAILEDATLERANLESAFLAGASLKRSILKGTRLEGAFLNGAILEGAILEEAILKAAILEGAILRGANLKGAYLNGAYLGRANLESANLEGANLEGANLEGANLVGANLMHVHSDELTIWPEGFTGNAVLSK